MDLRKAYLFAAMSPLLLSGTEGIAFFESKIRPVVEEHCLKCHSEAKKVKGGLLLDRKAGWIKGGDSGPVILPGNPDESLLIQMIRHDEDVEAMPPKSKLSDAQIRDFEHWIRMGAPDPRGEKAEGVAASNDFNLEERKQWWSLQPVRKVTVPPVKNETWPRTDLDRFLLAEIEKRGWKPASETDRVTLFRRASVVLTGLAPSPEELAVFLRDTQPGGYERAVDRLLASPHFGEKWARHWMDVVRYGESKAFESDYSMPYASNYRDYLIRAFNNDVPFDQFVREALAGDLITEPRLDTETGFNESIAGPGYLHLADGHHGVTDLHEDEARVIDGIINVVGTAFHGLTIACARCHDHKFDAITDEDYYSLYGMFRSSRLHYANVAEGKWTTAKSKKLRSAHAGVVGAVLADTASGQTGLVDTLKKVKALAADAKRVKAWKSLNPKDQKGRKALQTALVKEVGPEAARWFEILYGGKLPPELAGLKERLEGRVPQPSGGEAEKERGWLADGVGFEDVGRGQLVVNPDDPRIFVQAVGSGLVAGHRSPRLDGTVRSADFVTDGNSAGIWVKGRNATVSLVIRNHELVGHGPTTGVLKKTVNHDEWRLYRFPTRLWPEEVAYFQVQHLGGIKRVRSARAGEPAPSDDAWVAVTSRRPDWAEVWASEEPIEKIIADLLSGPKTGAGTEVLGALFATKLVVPDRNTRRIKEALSLFKTLRDAIDPPVFVRTLAAGTDALEPVYIRGNHKRPSNEENPRRFLAGLGGEAIEGRGSGRLAWAERLLDPDNPLTARVRVNRIWSRVFGQGIVASVDDFGKMGEKPSHPELLDFMATDFVKEGWSTKAMIRKMVLSSTFRMSSTPDPKAKTDDPKNVFLQHMPVRRMSAESIRDHILAASGELKRDLYGPSILAYIKDQPNSRARPGDGPLDGNGRRSIYLASRRNYLPSFLRAFDSPMTTEPVGRRNVTNVPAQSLTLLNDPMVHDLAGKWAAKMLKSPGDTKEKLRILHRQAFSREAREEEVRWGLSVLDKMGIKGNQQEAWKALCHIMINRKEFIYVF
ncbi:MAG: PSD1 and planctomycete cytochrome C domain-containing protein [Akkermansiaceae bacterium]